MVKRTHTASSQPDTPMLWKAWTKCVFIPFALKIANLSASLQLMFCKTIAIVRKRKIWDHNKISSTSSTKNVQSHQNNAHIEMIVLQFLCWNICTIYVIYITIVLNHVKSSFKINLKKKNSNEILHRERSSWNWCSHVLLVQNDSITNPFLAYK